MNDEVRRLDKNHETNNDFTFYIVTAVSHP